MIITYSVTEKKTNVEILKEVKEQRKIMWHNGFSMAITEEKKRGRLRRKCVDYV